VDTVPGLRELQGRRRELLLESDLNRQVLRLELDQLTIRASKLQRGFDWVQNAWSWAAPITGFFLARKFKKTGNAFAGSSFLIKAAQTGWKFWQSFRRNRTE